MKAIFIHKERDLRISDITTPSMTDEDLLIRIKCGGICGSDLHYFNHGGFGTNRLREPMILGHEVSGLVLKTGSKVSGFKPGDLVAVSPSKPCKSCIFCLHGEVNHCLHMKFYGSAMFFPHIQGAFREELVVNQNQCVLAAGLSIHQAAMAEPLAVVLHACSRAGTILGKTVLITGAGPIGLLTVLACQAAGASSIVVTDIEKYPLQMAEKLGASDIIKVSTVSAALEKFTHNKGYFDKMFECSGSERALLSAIKAIKPGGVVVQVGMTGNTTTPTQFITTKEITLKGSFRFQDEFSLAVQSIKDATIDVMPLVSDCVHFLEAEKAFILANDKRKSVKIQLLF